MSKGFQFATVTNTNKKFQIQCFNIFIGSFVEY